MMRKSGKYILFSLFVPTFLFYSIQGAKASSFFDASVELQRESTSGKIFAVIQNKIYHLRSLNILQSYAYKAKKITEVSFDELKNKEKVRLIKSSLGSRVYAIDDRTGQKLWYPSEKSFLDSGEKWDEIFQVSVDDSRAYQNAQLIKSEDDPKVYFLNLDDASRAPIKSAEDFLAAGFDWYNVLVVPKSVIEGYTLVSDFDPNNFKPIEPLVEETQNDNLIVSLLSATKSQTYPSGTARNEIMKVKFSIANGSASVRSLVITRKGIARDEDISQISIYNEQGFLLTQSQHLNNGQVVLKFPEAIIVNSYQSVEMTVALGFNNTVSTDRATLSLAIIKPSDIDSSVTISGSFPIQSATHFILNATSIVGQLSIDAVEISNTIRKVTSGAKDQELNRFTFTTNGSNEDVSLDKLVLTERGSARIEDFINYELVDDRNKIVAKQAMTTSTTVGLKFTSAYTITKGKTQEFTLRADVVGFSERFAQFIIENDFDVYAKGKSFGYYVIPKAGSFEGNFPVGNGKSIDFNAVQINPGDVVVLLDAKSPNGPTTKGAESFVLAILEVRSIGRELSLDKVDLKINTSSPHTPLVDYINIKKSGSDFVGQVSASSVMDQTKTVSLSTTVIIKTGQSYKFEIYGKISDQATTSDSYQVEISNITFSSTNTSDELIASNAISGNVRTVQEVNLLVRSDTKFTDSLGVVNQVGEKVGRLLFRASAGEAVVINQVTLEPIGSSQVRFSDGFSNLKLGTIKIATPSAPPYRFDIKSKVSAGKEVGFDILVDAKAPADLQTVQFRVSNIVATGYTSGAKIDADFNDAITNIITFKKSSLNIELDPAFAGGQAVKGKGVTVGSFSITASGAEDIALNAITLTEASGSSGLSIARGYKNLKLVDANTGKTKSSTVGSPVGGTGGDRLTGVPTLAPRQTIKLKVVVDADNILTGDKIQLLMSRIEAVGKSSKVNVETIGLPTIGQTVIF